MSSLGLRGQWQWWDMCTSEDSANDETCVPVRTVMRMRRHVYQWGQWEWWDMCTSEDSDDNDETCVPVSTVRMMRHVYQWGQWWEWWDVCTSEHSENDETCVPVRTVRMIRHVYQWGQWWEWWDMCTSEDSDDNDETCVPVRTVMTMMRHVYQWGQWQWWDMCTSEDSDENEETCVPVRTVRMMRHVYQWAQWRAGCQVERRVASRRKRHTPTPTCTHHPLHHCRHGSDISTPFPRNRSPRWRRSAVPPNSHCPRRGTWLARKTWLLTGCWGDENSWWALNSSDSGILATYTKIYRTAKIIYAASSLHFITASSELWKVLFLAPSVCCFLFVCEISPEPLNGFAPNSHKDVFGPSLGRVW